MNFDVVGSALYVEEPTDLDVLVLVDAGLDGKVSDVLCDQFEEFQQCGEYDDQNHTWASVRKGHVNLIVTCDPKWYERCLLASTLCHALKLQDKGDRIVAYRVIRDGYDAEDANARRDGRS